MDTLTTDRDYRFLLGLLMGACVGAGLTMLLAPRASSEIRHRVAESSRSLGERASARYKQATNRLGETVDDVTRTGQGVRDDVADAVVRGAVEVQRRATAAKG